MYTNQIKFFLSCCLLSLSLGQVDYNSEIQPIFSSRCTTCHSGSDAEEDLSLDSYNNVMNGGNSGDVVIPYDQANSLLWQYVNSGFMPPNGSDLTDTQVDLVAQWIDEGAFSEPGDCIDPQAYNCVDDVWSCVDEGGTPADCMAAGYWPNYTFLVGTTPYINGCSYDNTDDFDANLPVYLGGCELGLCEGYYNPEEAGYETCDYYQAPDQDDITFTFTVADSSILVDWSAFSHPNNAIVIGYNVSRCTGMCDFITGNPFQGGWENGGNTYTETSIIDSVDWEMELENCDGIPETEPDCEGKIKYSINVRYSNAEQYGMAISTSYVIPCNHLGNMNNDYEDVEDPVTGEIIPTPIFNVLDIVILANCVLVETCGLNPDGSNAGNDFIENGCAADLNGDSAYNVLDIVILANCVLANNCGGRVDDASEATLIKNDNKLSFEADGFIGGVQMTLTHGSDFTIKMTDRALFADYLTTGNETRLLVITPETEELFSFTGEFEITEVIVANSEKEVSVNLPLAASFNLSDAYPNPFNPVTTMTLTMPVSGDITVEVYNLLGQVVATLASGYMEASTYTLTWDASNASSGVYFVQADAEGFTKTQKLMLVK